MDAYCKNFQSGYCERVKRYTPKGWCDDICKGNWDGKKLNSSMPTLEKFHQHIKDVFGQIKQLDDRRGPVVKDRLTSVIIVAREEPFLNETIQNLRDNAVNQIEFIVGLDGYEAEVKDERVKVVRFKEPVGRRVAVNRLSKEAKGEFLFHIDAHCKMTKGWDFKLKSACEDKSVVTGIMSSLDRATFEKNRYTMRGFVYIDPNYRTKWWGSYKPIEECDLVEENMAFTGCGWMIPKEYYWQLGGHDESLGQWGFCGSEWSLKVWLEGKGKILLRTDVICDHAFSMNRRGERYQPEVLRRQVFTNKMRQRYEDKIDWLVDKFEPVPGWNTYRLFKGKVISGKITKADYQSKVAMSKTFLEGAVKHVKSGLKNRTKEEQDACVAICKKCEHFEEETKLGPRCRKCGCCLKIKKRWATADCPLGKWKE